MMPLTDVLLTQQMGVFFSMAAVFSLAAWFVSPHISTRQPESPVVRHPMNRREEEAGARFIPSWAYRHYRNPMRTLRRFLGYTSGRQWVRARKRYNREFPNGARAFALKVQQLTHSQTGASASPSVPMS